MKIILLLGVVIIAGSQYLISHPLLQQTITDSTQKSQVIEKFDPTRNAANDIQLAISMAHETGKRVLLDVGGEWCIWCHRLDSLFLFHRELRIFRDEHYVHVKVNVSKENKNEKVLASYPQVTGYPHLFILEEDGKLIKSQDTGELEYPKDYFVKGHDKDKVFAFLKKWAK
jgi:thiol:disulfide interchange protein